MQDTALSIINEMKMALCSMEYEKLEIIVQALENAKHIFCLGAGRSRIVLSTLCMRLRHLGFDAYLLGDLYCPPVEMEDVVIVASGSGYTTSVCALAEKCKNWQTINLVFTSDLDSPLAMLGDQVVHIPSSSSLCFAQGGQIMRSLFEQVLFIISEALVTKLAAKMDPTVISQRHANVE